MWVLAIWRVNILPTFLRSQQDFKLIMLVFQPVTKAIAVWPAKQAYVIPGPTGPRSSLMLSAYWHTTESVHLPTLLINTALILATLNSSLDKCYCISTLDLLISLLSISSQQPKGYQQNIYHQIITFSLSKLQKVFTCIGDKHHILPWSTRSFRTDLPYYPHCIKLFSQHWSLSALPVFLTILPAFFWFWSCSNCYSLHVGGPSPNSLSG